MSAVKTLQIRIVNPKAERLIGDLVSQNLIEIDEPKISHEKTPLDWHDQWCREFIEHQKQDGVPDEELITVPEVVAICKEARAERYAEEQKDAACR
jgi:hypothetical protein